MGEVGESEKFITASVPSTTETIGDLISRLNQQGKGDLRRLWRRQPRSNGIEAITADEKQRIFGPPIASLKTIFSEHGIETPSTQELLDRILVLDDETFELIYTRERESETTRKSGLFDSPYASVVGAVLPSGLAIVNYAPGKKAGGDDAAAQAGIHELLHTLRYSQNWESSDGLLLLHEGIVDYYTREVFRRIGKKLVKKRGYAHELQVVDALAGKIGEPLLFRATFMIDGFSAFEAAIHDKEGRSLLSHLAVNLEWERRTYENFASYILARTGDFEGDNYRYDRT